MEPSWRETYNMIRKKYREEQVENLREGRKHRGGFFKDKSKYSRKSKYKDSYDE